MFKATHLIVYVWSVESHIDGVCGGVMVWSQWWLLFWLVAHYKVHNCSWRLEHSTEHVLTSVNLYQFKQQILLHGLSLRFPLSPSTIMSEDADLGSFWIWHQENKSLHTKHQILAVQPRVTRTRFTSTVSISLFGFYSLMLWFWLSSLQFLCNSMAKQEFIAWKTFLWWHMLHCYTCTQLILYVQWRNVILYGNTEYSTSH
jgi:hypothetical protein